MHRRRVDITTGRLILELAQAIERLDDDQGEHYRLLSKALLSCYLNDGQHTAVIISSEQDSSATLVALHSDNEQITEMLAQMSELMGGVPRHYISGHSFSIFGRNCAFGSFEATQT